MGEEKVKQWCRGYKNGRTTVHGEERSGRFGIQTDENVDEVNLKLWNTRYQLFVY